MRPQPIVDPEELELAIGVTGALILIDVRKLAQGRSGEVAPGNIANLVSDLRALQDLQETED